MWVTAGSPIQDWALQNEWARANLGSADAAIPVRVQLRVNACVCDLLASAALARDHFALETARAKNHQTVIRSLSPSDRHHDVARFSAERWANIHRLTIAVKTTFMFARAFYDASYAMLLHAVGEQSGRHTSLNNGLSKIDSRFRQLVEQELPGFADSFFRMREVRNDLKLGVTIGWGSVDYGSHHSLSINLQGYLDHSQSIGTRRELTVDDVDALVSDAARFMSFVACAVEHKRLPALKQALHDAPANNP